MQKYKKTFLFLEMKMPVYIINHFAFDIQTELHYCGNWSNGNSRSQGYKFSLILESIYITVVTKWTKSQNKVSC